jgi:hypothetical protein
LVPAADADFVVVFTGPIFCTKMERIGVNSVAVPCQLYKVVLAARGGDPAQRQQPSWWLDELLHGGSGASSRARLLRGVSRSGSVFAGILGPDASVRW